MAPVAPSPVTTGPARKLWKDLAAERRAAVPYPPGPTDPSLRRTRRFAENPLALLLECYERYGPVFTVRIFHQKTVFMLGPEANHYVTVSHADNFRWREGHMGDLIPLLGDGLLTIDGAYHRQARRVMLPAFHHQQVAQALDAMSLEADQALNTWRAGERIDAYAWTRRLAMRIALRALFGLDPDSSAGRVDAAAQFERALGFYSRDYFLQILRGPGSPFARMQRGRAALDGLILEEIERRRTRPNEGTDVLSRLLAAHDEDGAPLAHAQIRDQVMTLLFAGHDTTTSTVSFLLYELARHPEVMDALQHEYDRVLGGRSPTANQLMSGALPELEMALEETLRLYPPAWIGPRQSVADFEFAGHTVPGGVPVNYCSWASHHLPDVFSDPETFRPSRFSAAERARLPKGAYVPFGAGSRTCIGMRFGQLEIRLIAALIIGRFDLELAPGYRLAIRQMPTISPVHGMVLVPRERSRVPRPRLNAA